MSKALEFPTTRWTELAAIRDGHSTERAAALTELAIRYRRPLMAYLMMKVRDMDRAQELFQEFFADSLAKDFFGKASRERGRFRAFLKTSVDRFLIDKYRRERARTPSGGFVSPSGDVPFPDPVNDVTPESVYAASWIHDVIIRAVERYRAESGEGKQALEFSILESYVIKPCLDGDDRPSLQAIAGGMGLTRKQAETFLDHGAARLREFLLSEVNIYSLSEEETDEEIADLYRILGQGGSVEPD